MALVAPAGYLAVYLVAADSNMADLTLISGAESGENIFS